MRSHPKNYIYSCQMRLLAPLSGATNLPFPVLIQLVNPHCAPSVQTQVSSTMSCPPSHSQPPPPACCSCTMKLFSSGEVMDTSSEEWRQAHSSRASGHGTCQGNIRVQPFHYEIAYWVIEKFVTICVEMLPTTFTWIHHSWGGAGHWATWTWRGRSCILCYTSSRR